MIHAVNMYIYILGKGVLATTIECSEQLDQVKSPSKTCGQVNVPCSLQLVQ